MATAQEIIEAAYAGSTANDPGKLATDGELLGVLNRVFQALYAVMAVGAPDRALAFTNLAALSGTPALAALPTDMIDLRDVEAVSGTITAGAKINLIPAEEKRRTSWHLAPAVYRRGNSLVSRGGVGDPASGDVLGVLQIDAPAALSTLATTIDVRFPVRHHELLVVQLKLYLATKDTGQRQAQEFAALTAERNMYLETFLQLAGLSMSALQSPHGGVVLQKLNALLQHKAA